MAQSYLGSPSILRLPELMTWLHNGELKIPSFQREIVWSEEQRISLCDTIRRGLPMGSIMVWRTRKKIALGGFHGPFNPEDGEIEDGLTHQYLLDGQQRLTTLFAALGPALWSREDKRIPWRDKRKIPLAPDESPWSLGFDLGDENGAFVALDEEAVGSPQILPLSVFLDDSAYDDWREEAQPSREQKNRARSIRSAFIDYLIPVVPLATDDLEAVTLTFKRVNSGGTNMGHFDMVRALSWGSTFDLEKVLEEKILPRLDPLGWAEVKRDDLLKVIATGYGLQPVGIEWEKLSEKIAKEPEKLELIADSLAWAAEVVGEIGFQGPATLPYNYILVFAARAWQGKGAELAGEKLNTLKVWLVDAAMNGRFSGGATPHMIRAAWRELAEKLGLPFTGKRQPKKNRRLDTPKPTGDVNFGWARPVITAAVLAAHGPCDASGQKIDRAGQNIGRYGKFWYHKLLSPSEYAMSKNGLGRTAANRLVCGSEHLAELQSAIHRKDCSAKLRESHGISLEAHKALLDHRIDDFLGARFRRIIELENKWLKSHRSKLRIPMPTQ